MPAARCTSPFAAFLRFSDWLYAKTGRTDSIALARLAELLFNFLTEELGQNAASVAAVLWRDYQRGGRPDVPPFLQPLLPAGSKARRTGRRTAALKRQSRHLTPG